MRSTGPGGHQASKKGPVPPSQESQLSGDEIWQQLWAPFRPPTSVVDAQKASGLPRDTQLYRGFIGRNFTINAKAHGPDFEKLGWLPEPQVWFRSFNVPEDDQEVVYHTNLKEGGGESMVERSDGLIEARWEFTKAEHNDDLGFHHPNARPMAMITLTDTCTVGLPLEVLGWPERANLPSNGTPGDIKTDPASVYSWWCETLFLAARTGEGIRTAQGRTSLGVVYSALPEATVMVRSNILEPGLIELRITDQPIDLRGILQSYPYQDKCRPPSTSDPTSDLHNTLLSLFHGGLGMPVQVLVKQVGVDWQSGKLMQQSATIGLECEGSGWPWKVVTDSHNPLLRGWYDDDSVSRIYVPDNYHLFTYADGAYMICAKSLNEHLQYQEKATGSAPAWVMEVGVISYGFPGKTCRVRTYLKDGRVERWDVLEYFSAPC